MAAPTVAEIRMALKTTMAGVDGLRTYAFFPDDFASPAAMVLPVDWQWGSFGRGNVRYTFEIIVRCSSTDARAGQDTLDALISPTGDRSIPLALWADRTLGGVVSDSVIREMRNYGYVDNEGQARYFQATLDVDVEAPGI